MPRKETHPNCSVEQMVIGWFPWEDASAVLGMRRPMAHVLVSFSTFQLILFFLLLINVEFENDLILQYRDTGPGPVRESGI